MAEKPSFSGNPLKGIPLIRFFKLLFILVITHHAFGTIRDTATGMSTGEAAGAASALSVRQGVTPRNLDVKLLQKALLAQGVLLYPDNE